MLSVPGGALPRPFVAGPPVLVVRVREQAWHPLHACQVVAEAINFLLSSQTRTPSRAFRLMATRAQAVRKDDLRREPVTLEQEQWEAMEARQERRRRFGRMYTINEAIR